MSKKIIVSLVVLMATIAIILNVYDMGKTGFNTDKITICTWALSTMIWCIIAYKQSV